MASISVTPAVAAAVRALPADPILLRNLWRELEAIATDVVGRTIYPPPVPHRQDRRLAAFFIEDGQEQRWGVSATLTEVNSVVTIFTLHAANAEEYADLDQENENTSEY